MRGGALPLVGLLLAGLEDARQLLAQPGRAGLPGNSCRTSTSAPDRRRTDRPLAQPVVEVLSTGEPSATLVSPRPGCLELSVGYGLVDTFSRGTCVRCL